MRISDWSSDVCSSDLELARPSAHADRRSQLYRRCRRQPHGARIARRIDDHARSDRTLPHGRLGADRRSRSEEHTSELQSLMRISYAVLCLKKKKKTIQI